jgi:hypothetical protein
MNAALPYKHNKAFEIVVQSLRTFIRNGCSEKFKRMKLVTITNIGSIKVGS